MISFLCIRICMQELQRRVAITPIVPHTFWYDACTDLGGPSMWILQWYYHDSAMERARYLGPEYF